MKKRRLTKQSFMKGVFVLIVSQTLIKILGLVYRLYLTNRQGFGDKGNAIYGSGFQIYALLLTISSVGVPNAIAKLVSERVAIEDFRGANRIFKIAFLTFGMIGFLSSCTLFFGAQWIANQLLQIPEAELTLVALSPSIFFVTMACVIKGYFNGRENLQVTANSQTLEQVLKTFLSVVLVELSAIVSGASTALMAAGANLATTLATALCFAYLYRYYQASKSEIANEMKHSKNYQITRVRKTIQKILSVSIPMSLGAFLGTVNKNIDSMTVVRGLKKYLTEEEAKIQYGILTGKVDTLVTLPMSFNMAFATALVPAISSLTAKGEKELAKKRIAFSVLITILIGLPCSACMFFYAEPILQLLFPNATAGAFIYQISSLGIIFVVLEQTMSGALHGMGKMMLPAVSLAIGVLVKLLLNLCLISIPANQFLLGGTAGAAFATVVCHAVVAAFEFYVLKKAIQLNLQLTKYFLKPLLATMAMIAISYLFYSSLLQIMNAKLATIVSLLIAALVYIIALILLKIFSKEELLMIPFGKKIYNFLKKLGLYEKRRKPS